MSGEVRVPAEVFHPAEFILEEMNARGWELEDLAARMGGDHEMNELMAGLYLVCRLPGLRIGDTAAAAFGRAFGVDPQYFLNLEAAWLAAQEPADPDLAALDALFAAATPGPGPLRAWADAVEWVDPDGVERILVDCYNSRADVEDGEDMARWIAALHNAWPSLKRDLEIGRAAVEVIEAEAKEREAQRAYDSHALGEHEQNSPRQEAARAWAVASRGLNAARARLRALREGSDEG